MNRETEDKLSFDGQKSLISGDSRLPSTPKQELLNNKMNESLTYHNNCLNNGRHSPLPPLDLSPVCDQNLITETDVIDDHMDVMNEDNDNMMSSENKSIVMTNGDINDNEHMDQIESHTEPDKISDDFCQQINTDLKKELNSQSTSDTMLRTDIKVDFSETNHNITIYLYIKDVFDVDIDFRVDSVEVRFKSKESNDSNTTYVWRKFLHGNIYPEECSHKLLPKTIELHLKKEVSPFRWNSLEPTSPSAERSLLPYCEPIIGPQLPRLDSSISSNSWQRIVTPTDEVKKRLELNNNFKASEPSSSSEGKELIAVDDKNNKTVSPLIREIKPKLIGWTGLQNLGNTCFMNAVVQCLSNTDPFRDYFVSAEFVVDINQTNPFGSGGLIAHTFAELLIQLWAGTDRSIAPHKLKDRMGEKSATFSSYMQQDAQEFCTYLLDALHEDLNRVRERPAIKEDNHNQSDESIEDQILADDSWRGYGILNSSIVTELFYGQYKSRLVCPVCGKISVTFDPFVYLSLPLPKPKLEYEVYFFKRDSNGMSSVKPKKFTIKLAKDSVVQNLLDDVSNATGVKTSNLRCVQSNNSGFVEKFLQPKWTLNKPETGKYLLIFELMVPKTNDEMLEFVVVQRLAQPPKSDNCAKCDKNSGWDNVELKSCQKCQRVAYCDKICQSDHWTTHRKDCFYRPEPIAIPFIISVAKSELTFRNLCAIVYSYARHSVQLKDKIALNLNEFPIPPPFILKEYRDLTKLDMEQLIGPDPNDTDQLKFDTPLSINQYYIALDWINSKNFGDNWIDVEPIIGLKYDSDNNYSMSQTIDVINLEDCLQLHTQQEVLTADNPWYCPKCKDSREAIKQITLWRLPHFLVIQLKRFSFRNVLWREKIDSMVRYPIEGLDMSRYCVRTDNIPDFNPTYDLYGVVNHFGGLFGGHYTAFAQTSNGYKNIGWRCFDDNHVEAIDTDRVVSRNAYMLFYKLRETN